MKEFIVKVMHGFFTITASILICTTVFCTVFPPDQKFGVDLLWQIIVMGLLCTMTLFIFYTKKELGKKKMMARQIIHIAVLLALLLSLSYSWGWIDGGSFVQVALFLAMVACVYLVVTFLSFRRDKKIAERLNTGLKRYKEQEE